MKLSPFLTSRIVVTVVFAIVLYFVLKRFNKLKLLDFLAYLSIFFAISAFVPAENLFFGFNNPISVLNYQVAKPATDVIEADSFAAVFYKKTSSSFGIFQTHKRGNQYRLPQLFDNTAKLVELPGYDYPSLSVYVSHIGSSDKALLIIIEYDALIDSDRYTFTDSQNSEFKQLPKRIVNDEPNSLIVAIHYAEVDAEDKDFSLFINNKEALKDFKILP